MAEPTPWPISIVLPTRNSMALLPRHLERHAEFFGRCAEIVHCDSESTDGTRACVLQQLQHPQLRQLDHPPGLYAAWNHAIAATTQPFVYISTVGETLEAAGAAQLLRTAQDSEADVVVSPPRSVLADGAAVRPGHWPIDSLIREQGIEQAGPVPTAWLFAQAVVHAPDGILGSLASCLFRGSFLRGRPFRTDFHGIGDSVWALEHLPFARCAVVPQRVATFLVHEKANYESHSALNARLAVRVRERLVERLAALLEAPEQTRIEAQVLADLVPFNQIQWRLAVLSERLAADRARWRGVWPLLPSVWALRSRRSALRREVADASARLRQALPVALHRDDRA